MEHESSTGSVRRTTMGVPGNLYITTTCLAFLPLDGSLKSSNAVMLYENLPHHKKGEYIKLVDSNGASNAGATDAVVITARNGSSIFLTDFLSMYVVVLHTAVFCCFNLVLIHFQGEDDTEAEDV
jgi:hypothetical protein